MTVYQERKDELERYEFMLGLERGRLAVTLDCITDALVLVGQHGVYCQSARQIGKPAMDIQIIVKALTDAKELIASVIEHKKLNSTDLKQSSASPSTPQLLPYADGSD